MRVHREVLGLVPWPPSKEKIDLCCPAEYLSIRHPPAEAKNRHMEVPLSGQQTLDLNPALGALFDSLPEPGAEWSRDARQQWLQFAQRLFERLWKDKPVES